MTALPVIYVGGKIPLPRTGGAPERSDGIVERPSTDVKVAKRLGPGANGFRFLVVKPLGTVLGSQLSVGFLRPEN
jgi:hypothetical protein